VRAVAREHTEQDVTLQLRTYAGKLFDLLTEALGSDEYFYGSKK
jgi:hypothetical protein